MLAKRYRLPAAFFKNPSPARFQKKENNFFVLRRYPSAQSHTRFAVVISKKVAARAVVRTRVRRALYDYIRVHRGWARPGGDVVIIIKSPMVGTRTHIMSTLEREGALITE